ncbi:NADPH-dependent FMN reductase [Sporosarcina sp. CAU 1771]
MKVVFVNGTVLGSKTKIMLETIRTYIEETGCGFTLELVDLGDYEHQIVDGRPLENYNKDMQEIVRKFEEADGYIIASPIFQGSIPGVLKNVFDILDPKTMRYKPVSIVANGGTYQHHLVIENQLKPILDYFRCLVTPNFVYTHAGHFDEKNTIIDENVHNRLRELARVFVHYAEMSKEVAKESLDKD